MDKVSFYGVTMQTIENKDQLEFAIFCIENIAVRLNKTGTEIYSALAEKSSLLYDYIIKNYAVLHTQDKDYITEDILTAAKNLDIQL